MKAPVILALSLTFGLAAKPPSSTTTNCTFPSDEEVEVEPGLFVTYHCGKYAPPAKQYKPYAASTPNECISACANNVDECLGAAWSGVSGAKSACLHAKHSSLPTLADKSKVVFMTYRKEEEEEEDDDEDPWGQSAEEQLAKCKNDLATCKSNASVSPRLPPYKSCPDGGEQIITIRKRPFKQICNKSMDKGKADIYRTI